MLGAFGWAAITGTGITAEETFAAPRTLAAIVADQLRRAAPDSPGVDLDADLVLMAIGGLAQGMLQGYGTPESALDLVERLLDRVVG